MDAPLRAGIVGAGTTRHGLGPYLARHLERAGAQVVAVSGRDAARAAANAAMMAELLAHPVAAHAGVEQMLQQARLDALIVAAPPHAHGAAVAMALQHRVAVLCEKPFLPHGRAAEVAELADGFSAAGIPLLENCQWPQVLADYLRLFPDWQPVRASIAMRLSPVGTGKAMVDDSLSHFLSLVQAALPEPWPHPIRIWYAGAGPAATALELGCEFAGPSATIRARLELVRCLDSPRPAWIELDGRRAERRIRLPDYQMSLESGGREILMADPLARLVYRFAGLVRSRNDDELRREARAITARARAFDAILDAWPGD